METGVTCDKLRLHRMGYFSRLMSTHEEISDSVRPLLTLCRDHIDRSIGCTERCFDRWSVIRC